MILFSFSIDNPDIARESMFEKAFNYLIEKTEGSMRVIWQKKGTPSPHLHENIKVAEWVPQNDLLGE